MQETQTKMLDRTGTLTGTIRNHRSRRCTAEGCPGWRIHVKWPDGRSTYPCSKGTKIIDADTLQII